MSCETGCFELRIPCCQDIDIDAGLTADAPLKAILSRPGSSKVYEREVVVADDGVLTLEKGSFPDGFFGFGYIKVELRKGDDYAEVQEMKFNDIEYNCLLLELADIDVTPDDAEEEPE